ncbi:GNAT family N-acetyltransferase [Natronomonas salsuginis]|uniref:GNAT family N-acetyltransferase n=1 Tax=Natronomonas salsuginis TaxID=2217661 RepID=A0A4U5JJZ8_9EURY|nr:GNAT family N-acetyltransferase [Natronomonas salsuginis]TKR26469.1 GNAT family N-acetyltransferase [Natronomonas salsuginis]
MKIYVAHPDDIDAIAEIARASWEADYPNILNRESVESAVNDWYSREQLEEELTYPWTYMYVAAEGGEVVGFAHAVLAENEGNILRIYVHPDERRRGIGRALFDRIRHELIRHDIERLNAMVLSDNALGNEFYADLGMERDERAETIIGDERFEENTYVLELT